LRIECLKALLFPFITFFEEKLIYPQGIDSPASLWPIHQAEPCDLLGDLLACNNHSTRAAV
jgi:hypothetical protein